MYQWIRVVRTLLWLGSVVGCASPDPSPEERGASLVDATRWEEASSDADPFADLRPAGVDCNPFGYGPEDLDGEQAFFVSTELCNYLTAVQPALVSIAVGDEVSVRVHHYELESDEPAQGQVIIALDGKQVWAETVEIPADRGWLEASWNAEGVVPKGTPVQFHVHNHGANEWALVSLTVNPH